MLAAASFVAALALFARSNAFSDTFWDQGVPEAFKKCYNSISSCYEPPEVNQTRGRYRDMRDDHMWSNFICECGDQCTQHGTCCPDSDYKLKKTTPHPENGTCQNLEGFFYGPVKAVSVCYDRWHWNKEATRRCQGAHARLSENHSIRDLIDRIPVTSRASGITYKNFYCAYCNSLGERYEFWKFQFEFKDNIRVYLDHMLLDLTTADFNSFRYNVQRDRWEIYLEKDQKYHKAQPIFVGVVNQFKSQGFESPDLSKQFLQMVPMNLITFSAEERSWTLDDSFNERFYPISVQFVFPKELMKHVKSCHNKVVRTCSPMFVDSQREGEESVKSLCESYYAPVKTKTSIVYQNYHCALCNFQSAFLFPCDIPQSSKALDLIESDYSRDVTDLGANTYPETQRVEDDEELLECAVVQKWLPFLNKTQNLFYKANVSGLDLSVPD